MKRITYQEAFQTLRQAGFAGAEIDRLYHLRQTYQANELDRPSLDQRRLEFIRWLVITGRLTDQLPEARENSLSLPHHRQEIAALLTPSPVPFLFF